MNTKQNKMEEFMASFETPTVIETDSKATTTKKQLKQTTTTTPLPSGIKTRLTTLNEMAKDIGRQEEESRHITNLVTLADLLKDLTHSVAHTSALDRQTSSAHQNDSDSFSRTNQRESVSGINITQGESGCIIPIHKVPANRHLQTSDIQSDDIPIHHVQGRRNLRSSDIQSDDIVPIHHVQGRRNLRSSDIHSNRPGPNQYIETPMFYYPRLFRLDPPWIFIQIIYQSTMLSQNVLDPPRICCQIL
ncbi:uncharacterized protein LOC121389888 [Gigantopelta aegis]|uniref:uncharacterized protein LOC121389888 n=1 Tax=Gigantopelta aegis TaxID=1735272 RepID=UPI001B88A31B|nr:uncharacterized protein LOC121389888 [Gigantopelta aegis]